MSLLVNCITLFSWQKKKKLAEVLVFESMYFL